jgi:CBS domain-containing protein
VTSAVDPLSWIRATPPFGDLPARLFDEVRRALEVVYLEAGQVLVRVGGAPLEHLYLVRTGSARLERDGQTLQVVEEGETFGYTSLITGKANLDVVVEEDLLAYRIPADCFLRLTADARFAAHFAVRLSERLKSSLEHSPVALFQPDLSLAVSTLVRREPVWVPAGATVREAAQVMRRERISSVLVRSDPPGILTDRDFRNRVLAEARGPDTPVMEVLSRPITTIAGSLPIHDAWRALLDAGVHHLPVTRGEEMVGVLSSTDLLKHSSQGPLAVLKRVERLGSRDALQGYAARVTEMTASLLAGGLDAGVIAGFVARLNDALLHRLLSWAEEELGAPPAPYAWMVFGSEGRMEQTLLTDQDNALVFAEEGLAGRAWYQRLAELVNQDLVTAGFPLCPGGYMARSWNGPLSEWEHRFAGWIDQPSARALLEASIFFDFRRVGGTLSLAPLEAVLLRARERTNFLRFLARSAMDFKPPHPLLLRLKGESSTVDLKAHGISPVVFLARCYALEAGCPQRGTFDRLAAAAAQKLVDDDIYAFTVEAYRFLLGLRLRLQLEALRRGAPPSNTVALSALAPVERSRLKDSLRAVKRWQDAGTFHFKTDF